MMMMMTYLVHVLQRLYCILTKNFPSIHSHHLSILHLLQYILQLLLLPASVSSLPCSLKTSYKFESCVISKYLQAVAAASAMSDRRCIASNGELKVPVSAEDLLSCCKSCGYGCNGGYIRLAWSYWALNGIVTGGLYNSSTGCKPYSMQSCDHHVEGSKISCDQIPSYDTPSCTKECTTEDLVYKNDLTKGKTVKYDFLTMKEIQRDILQYGPLEAEFDVYDDFLLYKSGVYHHVAGDYQGGHAVRIIGWGTENDSPYWLIANSWNEEWGDKGLFKIRRGSNECGIEDDLGSGQAIV